MQIENLDGPDDFECEGEDPYYDWDDPDWREDWADKVENDVGDASQGGMR